MAEEVGGDVQGLCPVASRERRLKEKAVDHVGGVGARETQLNATGEEE
jgi:hypothetical protein